MKKLILDGSRSTNKEEFFAYLNAKISLKENNLDSVYNYFAEEKENMTITVLNAGTLKNNLGNYGGTFIKMLEKAKSHNPNLKVRVVYKNSEQKYTKEKEKKTEKKTEKKSEIYCPYANKCGGCSGMKKTYQEETQRKQRWLEQILGPLANVSPIIEMEEPYHYRHKVHAVFSADRRGKIIAGVYEEKTHKVVDVERCRIEDKRASEIILTIKKMMSDFRIKPYDEDRGTGVLRHVLIRSGYATDQILVVLVTGTAVFPGRNHFVKELVTRHPEITSIVQNINDRQTSMVLGTKENIWFGRGYIEDKLCGKSFRISPRSFYQVNPEQTEILYKIAVEYAGLSGTERVIDAYCGIGTIGIVAADQAGEVIGVELNKDAVRDAKENAKLNDVKNIRFYQGDAGKFMLQMAEKGEHADVVFMDPPRSGSSEDFLAAVVKMMPEKVIYVSCNPEPMRDDLVYLMKRQYKIKRCQGVDLFPWTRHVECVTLLQRKNT